MKKRITIIGCVGLVIILIGIFSGYKVISMNRYENAIGILDKYNEEFNNVEDLATQEKIYEQFINDEELVAYKGKNDDFDKKYDDIKNSLEEKIKENKEAKKSAELQNSVVLNEENKEPEDNLENIDEKVATEDDIKDIEEKNEDSVKSESQQVAEDSKEIIVETNTSGKEEASGNTTAKLTSDCYIAEYGRLVTFCAPNIINDYHYNKGTSYYWMGANKINGVYVCYWTAYKGEMFTFEPDPNFKEYASVYADVNGNIIWDCMTQGDPYELGIIE